MENSRRDFIKKAMIAAAGGYAGTFGMSAKSYASIIGANDRVRVGIVGFSDRFKDTLFPCFLNHNKELNFDIIALSDLWNYRRSLGVEHIKNNIGHGITACRNNDELYALKDLDAVIISTPDFSHALNAIEAVENKKDVYCEKPFAETMSDNRAALKAVRASKQVLQVGSQRRSGQNYQAAADFIKQGRFGDITMVELSWNVNQPGRWRRPGLVLKLKEEDTDWKRFLLNRSFEPFDPRIYLEYRLFWPYSSGMPGQWMSHQIDTVHWFTGLSHPRSVTANGGIYRWKDGRRNWDTTTAVFDYGPSDDPTKGFQVVFTSRMHNGDEKPSEIYYSNGGELNLITNTISSRGGLTAKAASAMNMQSNLLADVKLASPSAAAASANTGADTLSSNHMRNWLECVRSRKAPHAPVEAGYSHSIANIMTNAAVRTGGKATFDEARQEVIVNGKVFEY
jgi:predicted dehydrogenase